VQLLGLRIAAWEHNPRPSGTPFHGRGLRENPGFVVFGKGFFLPVDYSIAIRMMPVK